MTSGKSSGAAFITVSVFSADFIILSAMLGMEGCSVCAGVDFDFPEQEMRVSAASEMAAKVNSFFILVPFLLDCHVIASEAKQSMHTGGFDTPFGHSTTVTLFYLNSTIRDIKEFTYKSLILAFVDFACDCDFRAEVFGQAGDVKSFHVVFNEFIE